MTDQRSPEELSDDERQRIHLAHQRLRNSSQALESLLAPETRRGRWPPTPAPPEALAAARDDLRAAYERVERAHAELLGWPPDHRA